MSANMELQDRKDLVMAERAAAWLSALREGDDEAKRTAFAAWLRESPRHVEEVLFASAVERALAVFDAKKEIDIERILKEVPGNVVPLREQKIAQDAARTPKYRRWIPLVAAGLAVLATAGWLAFDLLASQRYSTSIGEQRALDLEDGSLVYLNTQSQVRVHFTPSGRDIELVRGEALFKVAQDSSRPFRVHTSDAVIQALGTQFNVYRQSGGTTVSVLEGRVRVEHDSAPPQAKIPAELVAGEAVRVIADKPIVRQAAADVTQATAWRQRRLVFKADTLEDIAVEFNRYNRKPQIRIEGDEARQARFTGIFDADDPLSLVQLLGKDRGLALEEREDELVIRAR